MLELKHPSAFELEAWTVGEQTAEVEKHVQSCAQCRSIVDTLEIDRQEFLEEEGPEEFLNRSPVAELIASQIKDNKERRRLESRAELSQGLPYDAERVSEPKPVANDNIISLNPKSWVWSGVLAIAASIMFVFFSPSMFDSKTENTFRLKGASQINIILERDSVQSKHTEEVQLQPKDQFQVQVVLAKPLTLTVGILEKDGRWTALIENESLPQGENLILQTAFEVDDEPMDAWLILGHPEEVKKAVRFKNVETLSKIRILSRGY